MGRGTLSLKATIRLTLMLVVWSVILTAGALFGALRNQERHDVAARHVMTLADVAAADLSWDMRHRPGRPLSEWLQRVASWPGIEGMALLGPEETPLLSAPASLSQPLLTLALRAGSPDRPWVPLEAPDGKVLAVRRLPIQAESFDGVLLVAAQIPPQPAGLPFSWRFFAPLGMIGLIGVCIGILWLTHEVVRPIEMLSKISADHGAAAALAEPPSALRYAELAGLARTLRGLHLTLDQWRSKADQLEKSFDRRVAEETRRISLTLQRTRKEVWLDPLTGLYNRRMLEEHGDPLFQGHRAAGGDFSLVMLDVDHFKTLNDTLGHMAGDELLQFVAQLLKQATREEDYAVRYGGDEFQLLLPGLSAAQAEPIAQRIVLLFAQHTRLLVHLEPRPSLSAGVASLALTQAQDMEELMRITDTALYQAKRAGKNRVAVAAGAVLAGRGR